MGESPEGELEVPQHLCLAISRGLLKYLTSLYEALTHTDFKCVTGVWAAVAHLAHAFILAIVGIVRVVPGSMECCKHKNRVQMGCNRFFV